MTPGVVVIVPARFGAVRLPGKPLADLGGRPLVVRVLDGLSGCGADILAAATDDERIAGAVLFVIDIDVADVCCRHGRSIAKDE